jgi:tetratricopeptide (TPR) repeat protein
MKYIISIILILYSCLELTAQDYPSWQSVFEKSYELEKNGQYKESLEILKQYYTSDSYDFNIRYGWLYYNLGDYPSSLEHYAKAMELLPYSHEAKLGFVLPLSALGEWDQVIEIYNSMIKLDPKNTLVNYRLGAIYYERKEYQKAYNSLEEVINLYPNDYDSNLLFAWTNFQMGKLKEAKVLFNKVLLIQPDSESAMEGLKLIQ